MKPALTFLAWLAVAAFLSRGDARAIVAAIRELNKRKAAK